MENFVHWVKLRAKYMNRFSPLTFDSFIYSAISLIKRQYTHIFSLPLEIVNLNFSLEFVKINLNVGFFALISRHLIFCFILESIFKLHVFSHDNFFGREMCVWPNAKRTNIHLSQFLKLLNSFVVI